jgi:hypothetical protein
MINFTILLFTHASFVFPTVTIIAITSLSFRYDIAFHADC